MKVEKEGHQHKFYDSELSIIIFYWKMSKNEWKKKQTATLTSIKVGIMKIF